jgi:hypothetical protein
LTHQLILEKKYVLIVKMTGLNYQVENQKTKIQRGTILLHDKERKTTGHKSFLPSGLAGLLRSQS